MSDVYTNAIGNVMVVAPAAQGRLAHISETRMVAFGEEVAIKEALTRWVFADLQTATLEDDWGNRYDHQVHSLLSGTLAEGRELLEKLGEMGCVVEQADELFVPFQRVDIDSVSSSDALRTKHPRAFALARRGRKSISAIVTDIRDSSVFG